jgi:triosephosphate isomerase (TIM)
MSRQKIAAGNWKMNTTKQEALELSMKVLEAGSPDGVKTILCVPAPYLDAISIMTDDVEGFFVAAQNVHQELSGAYTGEISVSMLESLNIGHVVIGHSERREYFGETDALLLSKAKTVIKAGMIPIFCCGEPLQIRKAGTHVSYVLKQLNQSIFTLSKDDFSRIIIAYEPIWAIGTGETATPEQAQDMHLAIRDAIKSVYGEDLAAKTPILYGGSVKGSNAKEIFAQPDVDGGLVGGASLKADEFIQIMNAWN